MGVLNLTSVIKDAGYVPEVLKVKNIKNKKIVFDGTYFLHRALASAHKNVVDTSPVISLIENKFNRQKIIENTLTSFIVNIRSYVESGAIPLVVFDGSTHLEEKKTTKEKRLEDREKSISQHKEILNELNSIENLEQKLNDETIAMFKSLKKAKTTVKNSLPPTNRTNSVASVFSFSDEIKNEVASNSTLTEKVKKLRTLASRIYPRCTPSEMEPLVKTLRSCNIPVLFAENEGERLCATLARENHVDYVVTADSDILAFGAPLVIIPNEKGNVIYELEKVKYCLNCETQQEFIDLCILLGTDFNVHIPGIGQKKAVALHKELNKNLDTQMNEKNEKHREKLNIEWCRKFFIELTNFDKNELTLFENEILISAANPLKKLMIK